MSTQKFSGYLAQIYQSDDAPSAAAMGEDMKAAFLGADYELVAGEPCRQCPSVAGKDPKIRKQIQEWINGRG